MKKGCGELFLTYFIAIVVRMYVFQWRRPAKAMAQLKRQGKMSDTLDSQVLHLRHCGVRQFDLE